MGSREAEFALIIDDDPDTLLLVSEIVRLAGFSARASDSLEGALAALAKGPIVILLDVVMPDQLCDRIADRLASQGMMTPVVLMSSSAADKLEQKRRELVNKGVNAPVTMAKPFWVDELLSVLADVLPGDRDAGIDSDNPAPGGIV
ncbi:MAG: response regulator [Xanthomonadales bacterium]|nr:response regulator [Xanthomonadales bacterium]